MGRGRIFERHAINRHGLFSFAAMPDVRHCPHCTALYRIAADSAVPRVSRAMPAMTVVLSVIPTTPHCPRQAEGVYSSCTPVFGPSCLFTPSTHGRSWVLGVNDSRVAGKTM
jgi:hypothetical protein